MKKPAVSKHDVMAEPGLTDGLTKAQIANMRERMMMEATQLRKDNAEREMLQQVNEALRTELDGVKKQLQEGRGIIKPAHEKKIKEIKGYMSRSDYQKALIKLKLITLQPGAPHEGQHVFHIIAAANGGPDHVCHTTSACTDT